MSIQEQVGQDWIAAMKARDAKKDVLSLIKTELKNKAINSRTTSGEGTQVSDEVALDVLSKMAKQRREAIESFLAGGRDSLADKERFELEVIESYLPKAMTTDEISALITKVIQETGASSIKQMGQVMALVMEQAKNRADGKHIQTLVKEKLSG